MLLNEKDSRTEEVLAAARSMMAAARTAPKGRGTDRLVIAVVYGDGLEPLS